MDSVPARFGKGHGGEGGAEGGTYGQGIVVLALGIGRDKGTAEPLIKPVGFEDGRAKLLRLGLGIIEDNPTPGDIVAVEVVERIAFIDDIDIPLKMFPGIVGVLPLAPLVLIKEFLGYIPFPLGRV